MDKELFWHVFWNNVPLMSFITVLTSFFYNSQRNLRADIKQEIAVFTAESDRKWEANERKWEANERKWEANERKWDAMTAKMDAKWEAVNQRLDNTYNIIVEEIRSRKEKN